MAVTQANEYVKTMGESIALEREDMLARLAESAALTNDLKLSVSVETQHELQRLREELFKSRRNETQKERELAFMQRQLVEAAKRLAKDTVSSNSSHNGIDSGTRGQQYHQHQQQEQYHQSSDYDV